MKLKISTFTFFLYLISYEYFAHAIETNNIVVKIDSELITKFDIKNKIITTLVLADKEINQENIDNLKRKSLEDLIRNRLKKIELKKYNLRRDNKRINAYLNTISSNNIYQLKLLFDENNLDFQSFEDEVDTEIKWRNLIYKKYSKKININPEDINQEIKKIIKNQTNITKFDLSEIEIFAYNDEKDNDRINQILEEIKISSFEDAVIKFSISSTANNKGRLGWINSNSLAKDLLEKLNAINIGEISKPIKKQDKIIFLKLNDKKVSSFSQENVDKLKIELIEQKKNDLYILYSNSFLSKLKNTKFIEYYK